ncbi:MAG: hypothetical protein RLZZ253_170 [Verrucomicrobiota bacterium]
MSGVDIDCGIGSEMLAEKIVLFLSVVAFLGMGEAVGVGAFGVQDPDLVWRDSDFLLQFAKESFLEGFHAIDSALGELPGARVFEALTNEDSAFRIPKNSRDIQAEKHVR